MSHPQKLPSKVSPAPGTRLGIYNLTPTSQALFCIVGCNWTCNGAGACEAGYSWDHTYMFIWWSLRCSGVRPKSFRALKVSYQQLGPEPWWSQWSGYRIGITYDKWQAPVNIPATAFWHSGSLWALLKGSPMQSVWWWHTGSALFSIWMRGHQGILGCYSQWWLVCFGAGESKGGSTSDSQRMSSWVSPSKA